MPPRLLPTLSVLLGRRLGVKLNMEEIIKQWVEENVYPNVSNKTRIVFWGMVFLGILLLEGRADHYALTNNLIH